MDITITLTDEQVALAHAVGHDPAVLCQMEVDAAQEKWQGIADRTAEAAFLAKRAAYEQAKPETTKAAIEVAAVALRQPVAIPDQEITKQ